MVEIKTKAGPIIGDSHCVTVSNDKIFSVNDTLEGASNVCMCDLFEETSSNAHLKCESIESELNISNIKAGFTADKDSVIFNSTGHLVEADEAITEEGVYKSGKLADGYDVNLTDEEQ